VLLVVVVYGGQYVSLALVQSRLDRARFTLKRLQTEMLRRDNDLYEEQKSLHTFQKADETFQAIQLLTGDRFSFEETAELANIIMRQSKLYGYDPLLIVAIIQVESRFRSMATGKFQSGEPSGATGLMQIKQSTVESVAERLGMDFPEQDLMDAETNVMWGITYLTRLLLYFGDIRTAIIAYNFGIGNVQDRLSRGEILPKGYYHKVMDFYGQLKGEIRG
jgi:hypothetical protein